MTEENTTEPDVVTDSSSEIENLRARIAGSEEELNNYKLRLADFENSRKRLVRDAEAQKKYAAESLTRDLLTPLDNLDRALAAAKIAGDSGSLASGVSATASQFLDVLRRHGVTRIGCEPGSDFDPNIHEAVTQQPTNDFAPGKIVQVLQSGFMFHDRVLRPAAVILAIEPPAGGSTT